MDFAVIGLGRFGSSVALSLSEMGHQVLAIDKSEELVEDLAEAVTQAVQIDALDEESLQAVGIRNFDVVVVAIGHDVQASILTTLILKEMGIKKVVAKAQNENHGKVLEKVGADKVVFPERDMGRRVAHALASKHLLDYLDLSPKFSVAEVEVGRRFCGHSLGDLDLRAKKGVSVVAIKRGEDVMVGPGAESVLCEGDILVLIGARKALERFEK